VSDLEPHDPEWFARTYATIAELFGPQAPQPLYQRAFAEVGAIQPMPGLTIVGGRAAAEQVCRGDGPFTSEDIISEGNVRPLLPLSIDQPRHTSYRKLLDKLFRPAVVDRIEPDMVEWVNRLIDGFIDKGTCRVAEDFAVPFPSTIFLRMMGLPSEDTELMLGLARGILHPGNHAVTDPHEIARLQRQGAQNIYDYFTAALDERVAAPRDDVLTGFLDSEVDGRPVTREEILDMVFVLVIAGLDTVTAALTCFFTYLAQNDDHRRQLVESPEVTPSAVEELLRWESVAPWTFKRVTEDSEIAGCPVHKGDMVYVSFGSTNLDPGEFPEPFEVDFMRKANRHAGFGLGYHRCLGSHLARRELQVALREWHRRIPEYSLKPGFEPSYVLPIRAVPDLELVW
jgi:cytochrome P450